MSRFVMTTFPNGAIILSTEAPLKPKEIQRAAEAFQRWRLDNKGILILADTKHVQAREITLDLTEEAEA